MLIMHFTYARGAESFVKSSNHQIICKTIKSSLLQDDERNDPGSNCRTSPRHSRRLKSVFIYFSSKQSPPPPSPSPPPAPFPSPAPSPPAPRTSTLLSFQQV